VPGPKGFRSLKTNKDIGMWVGILIVPSFRLFSFIEDIQARFIFCVIYYNINETIKNVKIEIFNS